MLALIAAVLFVLDAFGVDRFGQVDVFMLALAFFAAHFAYAIAVPLPRRQP
jgi:hypothetical protein